MSGEPRPLVAGNWKMNGLAASLPELQAMIADGRSLQYRADLMICPPATLLSRFADAARDSGIAIGAQDCHAEPSGAFTGDLSAEMLKDSGATAVIVGHSERRTLHGESDETVQEKARAAIRAGLVAIVCVGETREEREAGATIARIRRQLEGSLPDPIRAASLVVAYEPVWAIGTGLTPTPKDVAEVHDMIRKHLVSLDKSEGAQVRILYGGSVKPGNAKELMAVSNVNGALVGGASLKATDFLAIAAAYAA